MLFFILHVCVSKYLVRNVFKARYDFILFSILILATYYVLYTLFFGIQSSWNPSSYLQYNCLFSEANICADLTKSADLILRFLQCQDTNPAIVP